MAELTRLCTTEQKIGSESVLRVVTSSAVIRRPSVLSLSPVSCTSKINMIRLDYQSNETVHIPSSSSHSGLEDNHRRHISVMILSQMSRVGLRATSCVNVRFQVTLAKSMKKSCRFGPLRDSRCDMKWVSHALSTLMEEKRNLGDVDSGCILVVVSKVLST